MTFGIGTEGFDPFVCPPCPDGSLCRSVCLDPIDGLILMVVLSASLVVVGQAVRYAAR